MIVYTGASGSIGSQMPAGAIPLKTRLEQSVPEMVAELRRIRHEHDAFIHLAALVSPAACASDPERAWLLNVEGSLKWFEAAGQIGYHNFVYVSTAHVFAAPQVGCPVTADSPVGPRSVYAVSKLNAERALTAAAKTFPSMRLKIARLFSILSPTARAGTLLQRVRDQARRGHRHPIPGLGCIRDFMEAADVCVQLLRLAKATSPPPIVLICSGKPTAVRSVVEKIFREYGRDPIGLCEAPPRPNDVLYLVGIPTPF